MKKPKKDPIREDRIHNEAIVDAYGPEERAMGMVLLPGEPAAVSLSGHLHRGKYRFTVHKGETVELLRMAPEESCAADMLVLIRGRGRKSAVPLSQLAAIDVDQSTADAIGDWHHWVTQAYLF